MPPLLRRFTAPIASLLRRGYVAAAWSDAVRLEPTPYFHGLQAAGPVSYRRLLRAWNVCGYEAAHELLRSPAAYSSNVSRYGGARADVAPDNLLGLDPPRHTQLRSVVSAAFTPRRVAALEPEIRALAERLMDAALAEGKGGIDVVQALSNPLPVTVIANLLGVPPEHRDRFKAWSDAVASSLTNGFRGQPPGAETVAATNDLNAYFEQQIAAHRAEPRDDLISALLAAEVDGQRLTASELLTFCRLLLVAGNETTTNLITNTVRCLLDAPAAEAWVREDPAGRAAPCVEGVLRYRSPVQLVRRWVNQPTTLAGRPLRPGQVVIVWLGAVNRDPAVFPDPDRFDPSRSPNPHMAFGFGPHFCLGAPLARLEAQVALQVLLDRLPHLRRADAAPLRPVPSLVMHSVQRLALRTD